MGAAQPLRPKRDREEAMTKILTGRYDSIDKARNALDELINAGFDREKVFLDREKSLVKVMTPNDVEREAREIIDRHEPAEVTERSA
jgi:hypothetical protein